MSGKLDGLTFITAAEETPPAVWGSGSSVAWSAGEPLFIVGPQGVGKSTLLQQLVMRRLRAPSDLLGLTVEGDKTSHALYIAADRPRQIARSWRRMVEPADHETLRDRLIIWTGPLPFDMGREPDRLLPWVRATAPGARTVAIDSLKDVALDLTKDDVGSRVNAALQSLVADTLEVAVNHHQRKGQAGGKPRALEDVYGSTWITAGSGSVLLLWGKPGDLVIELEHLKQPADHVGPMRLLHDHQSGRTTVYQQITIRDVLRSHGSLTARVAAAILYGTDDPDASDVERARRELKRLEASGQARIARQGDHQQPTEWVHVGVHDRFTHPSQRDVLTAGSQVHGLAQP